MAKQIHTIIYVTGLGDSKARFQKKAVSSWRIFSVQPLFFQTKWADGKPFSEKLDRLIDLIDDSNKRGHKVSLVGVSAGASMALSAFSLRKETINGVVCICGKINRPEAVGASYFIENPAFHQAIFGLRQHMDKLGSKDRGRILSISPLFDETVAVKDTKIVGAKNVTSPTLFHIPSIGLVISLFSFFPINFLKRLKSRVE